jgi:hypothetical protein
MILSFPLKYPTFLRSTLMLSSLTFWILHSLTDRFPNQSTWCLLCLNHPSCLVSCRFALQIPRFMRPLAPRGVWGGGGGGAAFVTILLRIIYATSWGSVLAVYHVWALSTVLAWASGLNAQLPWRDTGASYKRVRNWQSVVQQLMGVRVSSVGSLSPYFKTMDGHTQNYSVDVH